MKFKILTLLLIIGCSYDFPDYVYESSHYISPNEEVAIYKSEYVTKQYTNTTLNYAIREPFSHGGCFLSLTHNSAKTPLKVSWKNDTILEISYPKIYSIGKKETSIYYAGNNIKIEYTELDSALLLE